MKQKTKSILVMAVIAAFIMSKCRGVKDNVSAPLDQSEARQNTCNEVVAELEAAGFENISTEAVVTAYEENNEKVKDIKINGNVSFLKHSVFKKDAPVVIKYYKYEQKKEEKKDNAEDKVESSKEKEKNETEEETIHVDREKIETAQYDTLQSFFISMPTDVTPETLEKLIDEAGLFYSKSNNHYSRLKEDGTDFIEYTIADNNDSEFSTYSSYVGKGSNSADVSKSCVVVVFSYDSHILEYILYLNFYGVYNGHNEALYYHSGRFGDIYKILWNEYTVEDISDRYYYYQGGIEYSHDPKILNVTFRDDDDVPYYYKGKSIQTGFRICEDAKEAVYYTLRNNEK